MGVVNVCGWLTTLVWLAQNTNQNKHTKKSTSQKQGVKLPLFSKPVNGRQEGSHTSQELRGRMRTDTALIISRLCSQQSEKKTMTMKYAALLLLLAIGAVSSYKVNNSASSGKSVSSTALSYQNYGGVDVVAEVIAQQQPQKTNQKKKRKYVPAAYDEIVASDRTGLSVLLEPPAPRLEPNSPNGHQRPTSDQVDDAPQAAKLQTPEARQASLRRSAEVKPGRARSASIIKLNSIDDYHRHVLQSPDKLHVIRFSAPWCQVCRTTNVAWERLASRVSKASSSAASVPAHRIQFLSVSVDGKNEDAAALKDMLQIEKVPQGIVHHPSGGVFGAKVDMHRTNLGTLRKNLERYCTYTRDEDGLQAGMLLDGLVG